jgi:hypothetical protein
MRRALVLIAALAFATSVTALPASAQKWDKNGRCHDSAGKFAKDAACAGVPKTGGAMTAGAMTAGPAMKASPAMMAAPAAPAKGAKCKDAKGKFAKCGSPGAMPVK